MQDQFVKMLADHKGILLKVIRSYCKNSDDWKDLEQEIVVQLWKSFSHYDPQYKLSTWIYRIALNVAISHYRKDRKRRAETSLEEAIFSIVEDDSSRQENQHALLYAFIQTLDELNKALVILHLEDHSHREIAQILGITESNVGTKISRIKNRFKEYSLTTNPEAYGR